VRSHVVSVVDDAGLVTFITRNLPFVAQVALMGLEMTGLASARSGGGPRVAMISNKMREAIQRAARAGRTLRDS
jgi:hypothetical protein